ncbi:precorrin-3B C(17)-methyltransferase [Acidianus infernus]|uniref:Precorrin-3B C(17)-methyltransferase n=1 Tax=Acidianus infernus TaxID=12915 RepID=A0A6A9QFT1_ACIIN|nr:precorrin-3B C(17)-methyltransferase [Acidianus infernus]MUM65619.1 precorrin-3B C(17)-methyltransferase [Acidianus infernus]
MGKIYVVGIGPGGKETRTLEMLKAIKESDVIVAYTTYARLIQDLTDGKEVITAKMKEEVFRAKVAIEKALQGHTVAVVSSGDPQVYGMAGLIFDMACKNNINVEIQIIPGITAANAVAAKLGSPLSMDFAVISLSDLLIPSEEILNRVRKAAEGDFVIVLYNPINKPLLLEAMRIIKEVKGTDVPVGIVKSAYREDEEIMIATLSTWEKFLNKINMITTIIVGNSKSYICNNKIITPRGYERRYDLHVIDSNS